MNLSEIVNSQYQATLEMLKEAVTTCPESLWNDPGDKNKFWHVAYHALYFTHLYLHDCMQVFVPWDKHRKEYEFLGPIPWPPHNLPHIEDPYDRDTLLEYIAFCQQQVMEKVPHLNWEAGSGFSWLSSLNKLELQLYAIRHLQQHTGELMERLGSRAHVDIAWVASKRS